LTISSISGETKFYYNGNLVGTKLGLFNKNEIILQNSSEMYDFALIFGQEPDKIKGGFDPFQAFIGDLAELNIWNYVLNGTEILNMGKCNIRRKGNVVAWKKQNITIHNVEIKDLEDASALCSTKRNFVIFPDLVRFSQAKETCKIHGGHVAVPKSNMENSLMIDIVKKHKNLCIRSETTQNDMVTWIGAKRSNNTWYEINSDGSHGSPLSYTNLEDDRAQVTTKNTDCATLDQNGYWHDLWRRCTVQTTLCTICTITNVPVFTLKGICDESSVDWNYYMAVGNEFQIDYFDGYADTKLVPLNGNQGWEFIFKIEQKTDSTLVVSPNISSLTYPIGRQKWRMGDPNCDYVDNLRSLTLSQCDFGTEFTCDSGDCIDIGNRCNENSDCADESDEEECNMVYVPHSYQKKKSPPPIEENHELELFLKLDVMKINSINTLGMTVTITVNVIVKWYDKRLTFFNLIMGRENNMPDKTTKKFGSHYMD
jgi:hypothetical protein